MSEIRMTHALSATETEIVRAFAACNMHIGDTANAVYKSRNTVTYWLAQIKKHTGLDPKNFYDLAQLVQLAGKENA